VLKRTNLAVIVKKKGEGEAGLFYNGQRKKLEIALNILSKKLSTISTRSLDL
jgi:hypothetical protein